jgi:hypothetical protein
MRAARVFDKALAHMLALKAKKTMSTGKMRPATLYSASRAPVVDVTDKVIAAQAHLTMM